MATFTALFDACVLYPASIRDLLLHVATTDLFRARWTDKIHDEWMENLLANRTDISKERLLRTRDLMNMAVPDCLVRNYEHLTKSLMLPDPNDRHVLAAAIRCRADVIVTYNLNDFPKEALEPHDIQAQHPDEFIGHLIDLSPGIVCGAVKRMRAALKSPPYNVGELLQTFEGLGLVQTVAALRDYAELL